ncbi:MAG TPA: redoxin domain-containing protein [Vicinamibacterales bacterium]|nr:redoxin domain-containing protein [Vicinamibacterales bacterium]
MRTLAIAAVFVVSVAAQAPSYDQALEHARQLLQQRDFFTALKELQRANQMAGGTSAESFLGQAQAMQGMKLFPNAIAACQKAIDLADSARMLARAHKLKGQLFAATGDLSNAESELRRAVESDPEERLPDIHFELARVLLDARRDDEAAAELKKEIELRPNGSTADEARALLANPRRGRENYAPDFAFDATNGQHIALDTLRGKIVLLDFWASWCGPCVKALPTVKKVFKQHEAEPFVVLGISGDREMLPWRTFISRNGMTWPQFWDQNRRLRQTFNVTAIPTYVLIDAEGVERMRVVGTGFDQSRALVAEIDRQVGMAAAPKP